MLHPVIAAALASSHLICAHLDRPRDIERRHRLVLRVAIGVLRADVDVVDNLEFELLPAALHVPDIRLSQQTFG